MRDERPPILADLAGQLQDLRFSAAARDRIRKNVARGLRRHPLRRMALAAAAVLVASTAVAAVRGGAPEAGQQRERRPGVAPRRPVQPPPAAVAVPAEAAVQPPAGGAPSSGPTAPARTATATAKAARPGTRPRHRGRSGSAASALALQVRAFQAALDLSRQGDDARALRRWRAMARRWPQGALRPEVDFRTIQCLVRLERWDAARRAARAHIRRYPGSPRNRQMSPLLHDTEDTGTPETTDGRQE